MSRKQPTRRGSSLIELLIVVSLIALILSILMPALSSGRHAALDLRCRADLRDVTHKFTLFADPNSVENRGDSGRLGENLFEIEDFQECIYRIDEFWEGPPAERVAIESARQPLICPAGTSYLERRSGMPCSEGAIGPRKEVSIAFNKRLHIRTRYIGGNPFPDHAYLSDEVLQYADAPLLFDVNGAAAVANDQLPYYSAPPVPNQEMPDIYADGTFWFPSFRHRGRMNVGFIGGHVLSTADPLREPWWRWDYQPDQ